MIAIAGRIAVLFIIALSLVFPVFCVEAAVRIEAWNAIVFCIPTLAVIGWTASGAVGDLIAEVRYYRAIRQLLDADGDEAR